MNNQDVLRIRIDSVSKSFDMSIHKNQPMLFRVVSAFSGKEGKKEVRALDNVSFDVAAGEILGVIGRNGSGKSTLLRVIAGIFQHDSGSVIVNGNVSYLSGFSQGLKEKLTMRENIYLGGAVMGISGSDMEAMFDDVVRFSGLDDFVDAKLHQFSTGMSARLAFSIAVHCLEFQKPDILLLDEVLGGGGDIDFQKKAAEKMSGILKSGATVVLVSHNMSEVRKNCHKVVWLEKGKVKAHGTAEEMVAAYERE
ncbi:MAG TPA: ATP-binding cassette domain-containing protein [Candidatus Paceibacterota bacterium]